MEERLVVNISRFPYETVDGETILIDSETGHVLLLAGFATVVWDHLVAGEGLEALISTVNARFGTEAGAATRSFLQELRRAEILIATTETGAVAAAPQWPERFSVPVLERYDDISNIIAMDPIHDVGPSGWPRPANNPKT